MKTFIKQTSFIFILFLIFSCSKGNDTQNDQPPSDSAEVSTLVEGTTFNLPSSIAIDAQGTLYIADSGNHLIRKITSNGTVSVVAGSTRGYENGPGTSAKFNVPTGITVDGQGNLYIADSFNHKIRKITPSGTVSTLAGSGEGYEDGIGTDARFKSPIGIVLNALNNLYVSTEGHKIREVSTTTGVVSTLAGSTAGYADGAGMDAKFHYPIGMAVDSQGELYVADSHNHKIRKVSVSGMVSTFAGSSIGYLDGSGINSQFRLPSGVTIDSEGTLYIADRENHKIRKITANGDVNTLAGSSKGYTDGPSGLAQFNYPIGTAIDSQGVLYIADFFNHKIRKITQN
jgi:sugar lactone lactonase YvrE